MYAVVDDDDDDDDSVDLPRSRTDKPHSHTTKTVTHYNTDTPSSCSTTTNSTRKLIFQAIGRGVTALPLICCSVSPPSVRHIHATATPLHRQAPTLLKRHPLSLFSISSFSFFARFKFSSLKFPAYPPLHFRRHPSDLFFRLLGPSVSHHNFFKLRVRVDILSVLTVGPDQAVIGHSIIKDLLRCSPTRPRSQIARLLPWYVKRCSSPFVDGVFQPARRSIYLVAAGLACGED